MQPLGTQKITQPLGRKQIPQPLSPKKITKQATSSHKKIMQPLGKKKSLSITFRISKNIGHPTLGSGGKKTSKRYLKSEQTDTRTDTRTDGQTDGHFDL